MKEQAILLSTAYIAPVHFYARYLHHSQIYIEQFEHFNKQTYRNRCVISGSNGLVTLVVPVIKGRGKKTAIKDLQLSYDMDWQRNQWQTVVSAYNSSPYFEYYQDELLPFFNKKYKFLLDYNYKFTKRFATYWKLIIVMNVPLILRKFRKIPLILENVFHLKTKPSLTLHFSPLSTLRYLPKSLVFYLT